MNPDALAVLRDFDQSIREAQRVFNQEQLGDHAKGLWMQRLIDDTNRDLNRLRPRRAVDEAADVLAFRNHLLDAGLTEAEAGLLTYAWLSEGAAAPLATPCAVDDDGGEDCETENWPGPLPNK